MRQAKTPGIQLIRLSLTRKNLGQVGKMVKDEIYAPQAY